MMSTQDRHVKLWLQEIMNQGNDHSAARWLVVVLAKRKRGTVDTKPYLEKIENKTARVGVIGLGYVGITLVMEFGRRVHGEYFWS